MVASHKWLFQARARRMSLVSMRGGIASETPQLVLSSALSSSRRSLADLLSHPISN